MKFGLIPTLGRNPDLCCGRSWIALDSRHSHSVLSNLLELYVVDLCVNVRVVVVGSLNLVQKLTGDRLNVYQTMLALGQSQTNQQRLDSVLTYLLHGVNRFAVGFDGSNWIAHISIVGTEVFEAGVISTSSVRRALNHMADHER